MTAKDKKFAILAISSKTTGEGVHDIPFSIGLAYTKYNDDAKKLLVTAKRFTLNLCKDENITWDVRWDQKSFERKYFNEHWSTANGLKLLNTLHVKVDDHLLTGSASEMALEINNFLIEMEENNDNIVLITNSVCFDVKNADYHLVEHGYYPLSYTRKGKPLAGRVEIGSYIAGLANIPLGPAQNTAVREFCEAQINPLRLKKTPQTQLTDDCAEDTLVLAHAAIRYAQGVRKESA